MFHPILWLMLLIFALYNPSYCSPRQQRQTVRKACEVAKAEAMKDPHFPAFFKEISEINS